MAIAIGMENANATTPTVASSSKICSVPYDTEDSASEDNIGNAFHTGIFSFSSSFDLSGLPNKMRLTIPIFMVSIHSLINKIHNLLCPETEKTTRLDLVVIHNFIYPSHFS